MLYVGARVLLTFFMIFFHQTISLETDMEKWKVKQNETKEKAQGRKNGSS